MSLFARRPSLPDDLRRSLTLAPGDRILAVAPLANDEGWLVATRWNLCVLRPETAPRTELWTEVDRGSFAPEGPSITVHWASGITDEFGLTDPTPVHFAHAFRERVQSSVVHVRKVAVAGAGPVQVALRRASDGSLFTQVIGTGRVNLADPGTARLIDDAEREVRAAAGLRD